MQLPDAIADEILAERRHTAAVKIVLAAARHAEADNLGVRRLAGLAGVCFTTAEEMIRYAVGRGWLERHTPKVRHYYRIPQTFHSVEQTSYNNVPVNGTIEEESAKQPNSNVLLSGTLSGANVPVSGTNGKRSTQQNIPNVPLSRTFPAKKRAAVTRDKGTKKSSPSDLSTPEKKKTRKKKSAKTRKHSIASDPYRAWLLAFRQSPRQHRLVVRALARLCQWQLRAISDEDRAALENLARASCIRNAAADDFVLYGRNHWADGYYGRAGKRIPPTPKIIAKNWERFTARPRPVPATATAPPDRPSYADRVRIEREQQERLAVEEASRRPQTGTGGDF